MLLFSKHDYVTPNHDFLNNWDILYTLLILIESFLNNLLPNSGPLFVFSFNDLRCVERYHLLHAYDKNIRHPSVVVIQQALDLVLWVGRGIARAVPAVDRELELGLLDVDLLVLHELLFERAPYAIWLLETGVLPYEELDALVLEVVVHHALVVPCDADTPLLELSDDPLATLLGDTGDIALGACVLEAQIVTVSDKNVADSVKDWA